MGQCTSSRSSQIEGILGKRQNSFDNPKSDKKKSKMEKKGGVTRGQAMRFGFKRPPICPGSSQTASTPTAPSLPSVPAQVTRETIEPLVLNPLPRNGTPKLRNKKDLKPINRFGFVPPASLSNKVHDVKVEGQSVGNSPLKLSARSRSETRYNKPSPKNLSSNLSNCNSVGNSNSSINSDIGRGPENYPASKTGKRIPALVNSTKSVAADKRAKTVANNQTAKCSLGGQKAKRDDSILEIQQLEHSPSFGHKFRHAHTTQVNQKPRPREMVFNPSPGKRFDLRDLIPMQIADVPETRPSTNGVQNSVTERIRHEVVLQARQQEDDKQGEEKQRRDRKDCEKMNKSTADASECTGEEELWAGPGEAMAMDDSMIQSVISDLDHSPETMNAPLRSVLLKIEDPTFATLAALTNSALLEDETSPEPPEDISCSSPSSVDPLPPPPKHLSGSNTPGSPTHGTNSISSDTKERDFLIDDEIADQPGLVFDSAVRDDISLLDTSRTIAKLAEEVSQVLASVDHNGGIDMLKSKKHGSNTSINTLSPCDSLASDDLITDFDISALDDINHSPLRGRKSEILNKSDKVIKEWNALLHSHPGLNSIRTNLKTNKQRVRSTSSGTAESKSNVSTPRRTKQPIADTEEVTKEVAHLKSTLLRLQRVLQELETEENPDQEEKASGGLQQAAGEPLEVRDLRRQNYLLQLELEENKRQMLKLKEELKVANDRLLKQSNKEKIAFSNAASQTDRIRPSTTIFKYSHDSAKPSIVSVNDIQDESQKDLLSSKGRQDNGIHDLTTKPYRSRQEHHSNKILIS